MDSSKLNINTKGKYLVFILKYKLSINTKMEDGELMFCNFYYKEVWDL